MKTVFVFLILALLTVLLSACNYELPEHLKVTPTPEILSVPDKPEIGGENCPPGYHKTDKFGIDWCVVD